MFVKTDCARGFADLNQEHLGGVPIPTSKTYKEYFGPYFGENIGGFWSYDPEIDAWDRSDEVEPSSYMISGDLPFRDRWALQNKIRFMASLERPALPEDGAVVHRAAPCLYEGSLFQWVYVPVLHRWELLLIDVASSTTEQG